MGIKEALRLNCSTLFLLQGIGLTRQNLLKHGFIAAYTDDINHEPHYDNALYLLFQPQDTDLFQIFLENEYRRVSKKGETEILDEYDYAKGYVVVVYRFPEEFMHEYKMFKRGKYSKFRTKYTNLFPKAVSIEEEGKVTRTFSLHYLIFSRQAAIREFWEEQIGEKLDEDAEYWTAPDKREILDIRDFYAKTQ